jgi:Protein of unknown function (DUF1592)/Protein of unknown function (DUF1588)/Protein of unknown function (DUF1587)/Protein of unknown function (DUF1595)/Protein of unknown function (DUF1585)
LISRTAYRAFALVSLCTISAVSSLLAQTLTEPRFFSKRLYPALQKAGCNGCHAEDGVASATRLHFPTESASDEDIEAFGRRLVSLVDQKNPEQSLLVTKPTNRLEHTGGQRILPGSPEEKLLQLWVRQLAGGPSDSQPSLSGVTEAQPVFISRLTHSQYNNTVRDLLGDETRPADQFPQEDYVRGFKNQSEVQSIPVLLAEAYSAAAEKLARGAFRTGEWKKIVPCQPTSSVDPSCRSQFVSHFGRRAFRRPLVPGELQRYNALFIREAKRTGKFLSGAQLVVETMLQSPNFLFRMERGPAAKWANFEIASRLSYFLWDSMPDEQLFLSASSGQLGTVAGVEQAARRMLQQPRARQALDEFVSQWLRFDRVLNVVRDRRLFQQFNSGLAVAMTEETRRLVGHLAWNNLNFMEVYTARYGFLSADLAALYGFPTPTEEFGMVRFPASSDRAGLLGQATFLTLTSKPEETSPTERGLFIREHFLCQKVPPPPPGVSASLPPLSETKPMTSRERLNVHLSNESCASCHRLIDPIGFGLEKFDAIGRKREKLALTFFAARGETERKPTKVELELDTKGRISGIPDSDFSTPAQLGEVLASNAECQKCVVKQVFRYAMGRPETPADGPVIEKGFNDFKLSQFKFQQLIISLVTSKAFRETARYD